MRRGHLALAGPLLALSLLLVSVRPTLDAHPPNNALHASDGSPTNALWVDAVGNVGILTTTPGEALDVAGRAKAGRVTTGPWPANSTYVFWGTNALTQSAAENYALLQGAAGAEQGRTFLNSPVDVRFRTRNVDRMVVAGNGNVGIGTSSPTQLLDIAGATRFQTNDATHLLVSGARDDAFIDLIKRTSTMPAARIMFDGFTDQRAHQGEIAFLTKHAVVPTLTEWMRITTSGNVGIGTAGPADRFHVHGGNVRLTQGGSWPLILEQTSASVFTISNGGGVSFVLEPDGLAAIARVRALREGEHDFGHLCVSPRFPPGATVSQGLYLSACSSAKEYAPTADAGVGYPEAGDLVRILPSRNPYGDERAPFAVAKTERACDPSLVGFITDPVRGGADGHKRNEHYLPLAIYGYFPARVTLENGPIRRGDPITSSSTPGRGMKAVGACRIVGYALEDADAAGTVMVFAHLGEHATTEVHALRERIRALEGRAEATHVEVQELRAQLQELRTMKAAAQTR